MHHEIAHEQHHATVNAIKIPVTVSPNRCSSMTEALNCVVVRWLQLGQMNMIGAFCSGNLASVTRTSLSQCAQRSSVRMGIGHQEPHDCFAFSRI